MSKITAYTPLAALQLDDWLPIVDIHDTTMASSGTTKKIAASTLLRGQNYGNVFGDASDGAVTFDGSTTVLGIVPAGNVYVMTRDIFCTNITINNGVTVKPASCRMFFQGTLTNNGIIEGSGNNASSATGAGGGNNGSIRTGQPGGTGTTTIGNAGSSANTAYGTGNAGAGGTGASGAGGAAGTTNAQSSKTWVLRSNIGNPIQTNTNGGNTPLSGASGGGGGGGDTTNAGGGGGAGGQVIMLLGFALVNNGQINSHGGNGFTPTTGNCGGGGAGGGGVIITYTLTAVTGSGSTNVAAGTPGNGVGTGTAGGTATAGSVLNFIVS